MPIEFHRDGPWELPEKWVWAPLGEVVDIHDGRRVPINAKEREQRLKGKKPEQLYPYYGATGQVGLIDGYLFDGDYVLLGEDGAPFLERSRAKSYAASGKFWVNNHAHILSARSVTLNRFLMHYLNYADYTEFVGGTTRLKLTQADMVQIPIPVAPFAEQRRIVARIDELFTEIADGETALARARDDLDTWRRALLKAAVTGELTREWREHNAPQETAKDFLNRIRGKRLSSKSTRFFDPDCSSLPMLPGAWAWTTVPELCISDQRNGISIKGSPQPPGVKALRLDALTTNGLNPSACRYIPLDQDRIASFKINPHDFLISRANGSPEFVGRGIYAPNIEEELVFPDTIIRYPLFHSEMLGRWVQLAWGSAYTRRQILGKAKTSAGILKISQDDIAQIAIPLPPESEMTEAINTFKAESELGDADDYLAQGNREAGKLRQSILKAAFEGRLVAQDQRDQPAERLLARLSDQADTNGPLRARQRRRAVLAAR